MRPAILILVSVAIGVVGVIAGNWLVVTAMVLSAGFQVIGIWLRRRDLSRR